MTVNIAIQNSAIVLQTKVDILAWIGILPEPHADISKLESELFLTILSNEKSSETMIAFANEAVKGMGAVMDDGIGHVMETISRPECLECGKCKELNIVLQMLLDNDSISAIHDKINKNWGDIKNDTGTGLPGHRQDRPDFKVVKVGPGESSIDDLMKILKDISQGESPEGIGVILGGSKNPGMSIMEKIFGPKPNKDKLH
jgi:hypothetical protein